jgi:hypothetical protein
VHEPTHRPAAQCRHALDHLFLLIFAGRHRGHSGRLWHGPLENLMPYTTGAFLMFGLASVPAGRWGDLSAGGP